MRGRDYEKGIQPEYLSRLNDLYEEWTENFSLCPVLTVPADDLNYVLNDAHLDLIISKIESKLSGKEEVRFEAEEIRGS
jgi:deoxyadenosine/deoxycytidine kinase